MDVLLVEDDDGIREVVTELLADTARVRSTHSVVEALRALEAWAFHLVIADLRIRGTVDGGRQILSAARRHLIPVVVMTGLPGDEMRRNLGSLRPDAVLHKPFALEEALALCNRFRRAWRETVQLAEVAREGAWQSVGPGARTLLVRGDARSGQRLVQWSRGARGVVEASPIAQAGRVIEGKISVGDEALATGRSFFLTAGESYEIGSEHGGMAALVGFGDPRR